MALSRVLNGKAAISLDTALRIEAWLGVKRGGRADLWLAMQMDHDLWQQRQARKREPLSVMPAVIMA